jgi:lipopolysaccharide transport system ATP-binding protein
MTVIEVENLGKLYELGTIGATTLTDSIQRWWQKVTRKDGANGRPTARHPMIDPSHPQAGPRPNTVWALKDVSFTVKEGEVLGVIGRNGAGKSTLLKILTRITEPTEGRAIIHGRVASLLEVGTGFHPELTGRENVFLNGAVLGMTREEIRRKFDEIVAFAEVDEFLDTPVKRYSSGMYVRLAFAVAAHLEPEILLIDEVLAVGDTAFQKKCLGKMGDVAKQGRTVLFVSHNMGAVQSLCQRTLLIGAGRVEYDDVTETVIQRYIRNMQTGEEHQKAAKGSTGEIDIERVTMRDENGETNDLFRPGRPMTVEISYFAHRALHRPYFWLGISGQFGPIAGANMLLDDIRPETVEGAGIVRCRFEQLALMPQQIYTVYLGVRGNDGRSILVPSTDVAHFRVGGRAADIGLTAETAEMTIGGCASVIMPYSWELPDGRSESVQPLSMTTRQPAACKR